MGADYRKEVVVYGDYEGVKKPLMVDSGGRVLFLSSGWLDYTPIPVWSGGDWEGGMSSGRYKRMGNVVFFTIEFIHSCALCSGLLKSLTLPVAGKDVGILSYGGQISGTFGLGWTSTPVSAIYNTAVSPPVLDFGAGIGYFIDFGKTLIISGSYPAL
jgi:hypothetical protein